MMPKGPPTTVNGRCSIGARPAEADCVKAALATSQAGVAGLVRAFLRPSGTEPVVRVTVEADDDALVQSTLEALVAAVRAAAWTRLSRPVRAAWTRAPPGWTNLSIAARRVRVRRPQRPMSRATNPDKSPCMPARDRKSTRLNS